MKKILLTIAIVACGVAVFAQGGSLPFLRLNADARTAAMGNATMGESTGMYIYTNPTSFLLQDSTHNFYASYTCGILPKAGETPMMHAASVGYKRGNQALLIGFRSLSGVEVAKVTEFGTNGTVKPFDYALDLTYTRTINENFAAYVTGTFIQSYIGKTAFAGSASAGVYYRNEINDIDYTIGFGFYDLGSLVKYGKSEYDQPTSLGLGGSFIFNERFNVAWTARYFVLPAEAKDFVGGLGAEYKVIDALSVRAGYHLEDKASYMTAGLGYTMKRFNLNAAYQIAQEEGVDNSIFIGCSMRF